MLIRSGPNQLGKYNKLQLAENRSILLTRKIEYQGIIIHLKWEDQTNSLSLNIVLLNCAVSRSLRTTGKEWAWEN